MRKSIPKILVVLVAVGAIAGMLVRGQATKPDAAAQLHSVSPAAQALLDSVRDAYGKLKSLELTGAVSLNLDAGGQKENDHSEFTAAFQSPGKYRHEMKDDLLIVSNSDKGFVFKNDTKKYASIDPIKDRVDVGDLPYPVADELQQQNPSLLCVLVKDPGAALFDGPGVVDLADDATVDGTKYKVLRFTSSGREVRALIDPQTHLMRQWTVDLKQRMIDRGVPDVKVAALAVDYSKSVADAPIQVSFDWTPPSDGLLVKLSPEADNPDAANAAAIAMEGKPAPDFTLQDLDGKTVSLSEQKGSVVIVDFWATWCQPCVMSLPHLDAVNKEFSDKGLRVFAVNRQEEKSQVQKFVKETSLGLRVLMDPDEKVGKLFQVQAIPQTVLVGKDGKVLKVMIGFNPTPEGQAEFHKTVEDALKG